MIDPNTSLDRVVFLALIHTRRLVEIAHIPDGERVEIGAVRGLKRVGVVHQNVGRDPFLAVESLARRLAIRNRADRVRFPVPGRHHFARVKHGHGRACERRKRVVRKDFFSGTELASKRTVFAKVLLNTSPRESRRNPNSASRKLRRFPDSPDVDSTNCHAGTLHQPAEIRQLFDVLGRFVLAGVPFDRRIRNAPATEIAARVRLSDWLSRLAHDRRVRPEKDPPVIRLLG